jgi:hypothetical protein
MMDGLRLNPILGFVVKIFIYGFYFKEATLLDKNFYMFSSGLLFPSVCSLNTNVSEHCVCSILIGE